MHVYIRITLFGKQDMHVYIRRPVCALTTAITESSLKSTRLNLGHKAMLCWRC